MDFTIKRVHEIYDNWFESDDGSLINECMDELSDINDNDDSGEAAYVMGLLIYDMADDKAVTDAMPYFLQAIGKNTNHYMARLYAAHCLHDVKNHEGALLLYKSVDADRLKDECPIWRYVKLVEQMGECLYNMAREGDAYTLFTEVAGYYDSLSFDELTDPLELMRCLQPDDPLVKKLKGICENYYK